VDDLIDGVHVERDRLKQSPEVAGSHRRRRP
jgi:hypothetical protein